MNLAGNRTRLAALTRELVVGWQDTREHWRDAKAAEFERRYLDGLVTQVEAALVAMDKLELLAQKIRSDCE
jgi:hypothetical protein